MYKFSLLISFSLIGAVINEQSQANENFQLIGKEFWICVSAFEGQWESLKFITDSTCIHEMTYDSTETKIQTVNFRLVNENIIVFQNVKIKEGIIRHPALVIHLLDPIQLEKEFFGREFARGCFKELKPEGDFDYYLSIYSFPN